MCNCGNKRAGLIQHRKTGRQTQLAAQQNKIWADIRFRYTGKTALAVKGSVTGKQYRFDQPGGEQLVNFRDAATMMHVPALVRL